MDPKIVVDLYQLRETSAAVKADTEMGLAPGLSNADGHLQHGVRFGRANPSGEVNAAQQAMLETLRRHRANGKRHVENAHYITGILDKILELYVETDARAEVDIRVLLAKVEAALAEGPQRTTGPQP